MGVAPPQSVSSLQPHAKPVTPPLSTHRLLLEPPHGALAPQRHAPVVQVFVVVASQSIAQSVHPQAIPAMQTLLFVCVVQSVQLDPHDEFPVLATQLAPLQQKPVTHPAPPRDAQLLGQVAVDPLQT